jgi:hypothetical protein
VALANGVTISELLVHDDLGRTVLRLSGMTNAPDRMQAINVAGLPHGHYTVVLINRSGDPIDRASFVRR